MALIGFTLSVLLGIVLIVLGFLLIYACSHFGSGRESILLSLALVIAGGCVIHFALDNAPFILMVSPQ